MEMEQPKISAIKKKKTKKIKPELIIVEETSPKNITVKSSSSSSAKRRCKKSTQKYKPLGPGCFTQEDINNYKLTTNMNRKKKQKTKKVIELDIVEDPVEIIEIP